MFAENAIAYLQSRIHSGKLQSCARVEGTDGDKKVFTLKSRTFLFSTSKRRKTSPVKKSDSPPTNSLW